MESTHENIIYQGNSIITIENIPDYAHPVIIKKPSKQDLSRQIIRSLKKEYEMTKSLDKVEGVRKALDLISIKNQSVLVLENVEGETLNDYIAGRKLRIKSRLEIAVELARILKEIHQHNVIHLDFSSENIIIGHESRKVLIIDLGSATHIDQSGQQKVQPDQLLGSLPYIAPEQTGRINRVVDERSDLYSLGVVLYELMTLQLPFDSKDPLKLVHDHIARVPVSPSEISSGIPEVLSAIILKLLSKNTEDRYQSAAGIQSDLEKCLQRLKPDNTIEEFPLGEADYTNRLRFPQKLYGRDHELKELERAFESACRESSSIMFVGGYSGIGKTALVEEIQPTVSKNDGYFTRGKFDQYFRTKPYSGITQAFEGFISQILAESEENFKKWRKKIQSAVGDLGKVLIEVISTIEELLGTQPDVPQLGGQEAENRFNYVFIKFLSAAATKEHPLAIFIDDLQWIDAASLRLLKVIETDFDQPGLLVIGAYRDNEVDNSHPLMDFINKREEKSMQLRLMKLNDLNEQHLKALLSDTLKTGEGIKELKEIIFEKTHGNPFFSRRLLTSLNEKGRIVYDSEINNWGWNIADIKSETIADNVVDLLAKNIAVLSEEIRKILTLAACIGNRFDIHTLALISGLSEPEVLKLLTESLSGQYVLETGKTFEFVHDQVQQSAYHLIDANDRKKKHLGIGRVLLSNTKEIELDEKIFDIVNHYNQSDELLSDRYEKIQLAKLNLVAGRKAKLSSAFSTAAEYFRRSVALLGDNKWYDHYELTLNVYNELIEAYYLTIQNEEVGVLFDTILNHVKNNVDSTVAYKTMIMSNISQNKLLEAISLAEVFLESIDISFDTTLDSNLTIDELRELPPIENKEKMAALEILLAVDTPFIYAMPERIPSLIYTMLNIISKYGNSYVSGSAYTWHAFFLCFGKQYHEGNLFGRLGVDLLNQHPYPGMASKIMDFQYAYLLHWEVSVHDLIAPLKDYYRVGMQEGNFEWGLYCLLNHTLLLWSTGKPLSDYLAEVEPSIEICESKNHEITLLMFLMFAESVSNLTGGSTNIVQMEGRWFSEEKMSSKLSGNDMLLALFEVIKITLNYLFGDHQEAYKHVENALKYRDSLNPHYLYTKISFYGGLSCIGSLVESENDADRQDRLKKLEQFEVELKLWAEVAPMNYQHQYDLVMAEKCRISDRHWEAAQLYEKAIKGAQENQFVHDEALAHELSGQFWLEQGNDRIAEMYMREASSLYHQWGAGAKVSHLEECYPVWFKPETILSKKAEIPSGADKTQTTITQPISSIQLDLDTIISTSQMLSAETDLEQLLSKMITLVMANSGAETAVLLLKQDNGWFVQARGDITSEKYDVLLNQPFDPADNEAALVPECVFNYCQRSREVLVVGDAQSDQRFGQDRTIQTHNIKSMACIPVLNHGELKGMLYLENRQMADVFTLERLEILKHLSSQFGISAENALLYENLNNNIQELQESEMRFRSVVENANETILVTQDELVKYSNQKVEELIGYSMEEMSTLGFEKFIHPDDLNIVLYEHQTRISGEKPANNYTIRIITKAGQVKYVVVNSGMINWDGRPASLAMITDITDLKKKEWNLLQAQKIARLGFYDWDFQKDRLYPSEELIRIIGKGFDGEYTTSEYISSIVHPDDLDFVRENLELAIKGEKKYEIEHRILRPDGTVIWVASQAELFHDTNGKPERLIGTEVDITEQKKVQEKLKKSEERFRHLMEQSPMAMEILSPDGKIKVVNSAWKKLWKISDEAAAETIDKYNMLTDPQLEKLGIMDQVKEAFKGKHVILPPIQYDTGQTVDDFDIGILKKLRSPWIQCHLNAVKDDEGNIVFIVNTYVDITDLNKAMESVQKSEVFFRNLMEFSPLSIAIFRPDGKLIQVNTAWRELWGLSEEETARVMAKYNFRRDKQIEALGHAPLLERAFNGEHVILPTMDYEGRHTAENVGLDDIEPKTRTIQTHIYSVKDANGKIDYVVNINMDLTELRQAEQEAKQQRDVLARIDRASSMGQLTGSIAHELNQPLTGILSNAQAAELILQSKNYDLEEIKEILTEIVSDTKRAGQVIRNLRELYKEQKVELLPVEINTVVQEAVNLLQSEFVVRKVNLAMQYDNANPLVKGNKIQIQQVVFNLITNGIQAMTDKVRNERNLWITTSYETNEVKVCVIDSGQGINPKFIDNIFEPLATWKPDGTGMGLAISKSIIQAHGGRMIAENRPKGGACVCFILPSILKK